MNKCINILASWFLMISFIGFTGEVWAQTNLEVFGQNRVQYRKFKWQFYDAEHFKIYHYDRSGRELARYVAEQAEQDITAVERRLGGLFPERLNIILYNSYEDYQQSNIGLNTDLLMQESSAAGTMNIVGDKLVIYFTGNHAHLKTQLREGMARVVMERLMFGENLREIVRNAVLLNLPEWVTEGYIDYVVSGWTSSDDNDWKNLMLTDDKVRYHEIAERYPRLGGKAFWKYISVKYGENNVRNLLYLTQLKSSLNNAVKLTLQQNLKATYDSLVVFYKNRYEFEEQIFEPLDTSDLLARIQAPNDESIIRNIMVSPKGGDMAYVKWKHGEFEVVMEKLNMEDKKREKSKIVARGIKNYKENIDPDYPLLAWSNTGFKLGIIFRSNNNIRIRIFDAIKGKVRDIHIPKNRFDRVTGFTFMEDDETLVLSAIKNGQSDIFELRFRGSRVTQLTNDAWDDAQPVFVMGGSRKGIAFVSNRPEPYMNIKPLPNELPVGNMNAFFFNYTTKSDHLLQLTNVNKGNVTQIIPYGMDHFAYLSDVNGVNNRYVVLFNRDQNNRDSAYSVPVTNYSRSILYQQYNPASQKMADVIKTKDYFYVFFKKAELPPPFGNLQVKRLLPIGFVDGVIESKTSSARFSAPLNLSKEMQATKIDDPFKIEEGDMFQSEFVQRKRSDSSNEASVEPDDDAIEFADLLNLKNPDTTTSTSLNTKDSLQNGVEDDFYTIQSDGEKAKRIIYVDSTFIQLRSQQYRLSFKPDFFSLRADNSILFNRYQSYGNSAGQFNNPSIGGMFMVSLNDIMEDYRFTGGFRLEANFSGLSYFAKFENFRRRVDWGLIFLRQGDQSEYNINISNNIFPVPVHTNTYLVQGTASYPLDKVKSIRMHYGLRYDQMTMKASDYIGLALPGTNDYWAMSRAEYVYDNTRNPTMNIWNGLRMKVFGEYMYKLYTDNEYYFTGPPGTENVKNGGFYATGFDIRYYHKIYKNFIFAVRAAGAHSAGNQKIMYFLGGVDYALNPKFDNNLQPSGSNSYAFQTLANNMRGYHQNARNGNNYVLTNFELRFPVFTTLLRRPVQSSILKHLQLVAFTDVGNAWEGSIFPTSSSFQRYNSLYWPNYFNPLVTVTLKNNIDQMMAIGYGGGLRTMIFGYFLRLDAAWNYRRDFTWYVSIGTDF